MGGGLSSGGLIPTSIVITGSGGISSLQPGNSAGLAGLAQIGAVTPVRDVGLTISVGSGANTPGGVSIPTVTRNTIAFDTQNPRSGENRVSGSQPPVLPRGEVYRGGIPVAAPGADASQPKQQTNPRPGKRSADPVPIPRAGAMLSVPSDAASALATR
jgi:hypothetical protein